jgi:molybdopterin/thiamine biosynthesis adenylyltransferase
MFPESSQPVEAQCATMGVFAPMVGIIGSVQAAEALKLLIGVGQSLAARLLMLDGRHMQWTQLSVPRDSSCPVCGTH